MENNNLLEPDFNEKLKTIKSIPVNIPEWLSNVSADINAHYKQFRALVRKNSLKWAYFHYCENLALLYYKLALLHYKVFYHHKINLKCAITAIENCFNTLRGLIHLPKIPEFSQTILAAAQKLQTTLNQLNKDIEARGNEQSSRLKQASIFLATGNIENNGSFDLTSREFQQFYPRLIAVEMINLITGIEEVFTLHMIKDHERKSELCNVLAEAYGLCNQTKLHDYYLDTATKQITIFIRNAAIPDRSYINEQEVRRFINTSVEDLMSLLHIKTVLSQRYTDNQSSVEIQFIETTYIKYCIKYYLTEIDTFLQRIIEAKSEQHFKILLLLLDDIKHFRDIPKFFHGTYYDILTQNYNLLTHSQRQLLLKQFKLKCWEAVVPYVETAQKEADLLKLLILYLRSSRDCRLAISKLELQKFCHKSLSAPELIGNILDLNERDNAELVELQAGAFGLIDQLDFFLVDKFVDVLYTYAFPVEPAVKKVNGRNVIELKGKLIIISEIFAKLLSLKTKDIDEIHIVGADIVHVDTELRRKHWSSVNILIVSKWIKVHGEVKWDVGGFEGQQYDTPAKSGTEHDYDGCNGSDGYAGKSGGNIHISCHRIIDASKWTLASSGGKGGNGQTGGIGRNGKNGYGINAMDFKQLVTPPKPKDEILQLLDTVHTRWSNNDKFRVAFWSSGHKYLHGFTRDRQKVTYSYFAGWVSANNEQYLLVEGINGEKGGNGGIGGQGGTGGLAGDVRINSVDNTVRVELKPGASGNTGNGGKCGTPGQNGWDMGHVYVNTWFSKAPNKIIGGNCDSKLCLEPHKYRNYSDYVYCCYREFYGADKRYINIAYKSNKQNVHDRSISTNKKRTKTRQQSIATRINAISSQVIATHEEDLAVDVIDELSDMQVQFEAIKQRALEESVEKDEEKENEMTEFQMKRQAVHDQSKFQYSGKKFVRKTLNLETDKSKEILIQNVISNPSNSALWFNLTQVYISRQKLNELFSLLYQNKELLQKHYTEIYNLLLNKYKYAICSEINLKQSPSILEQKFHPEPIGNFLKSSTNFQEFTHNDLGILNQYFKESNPERIENLIKYTKTIKLGSILYPLKFFLIEKRYENAEFQQKSESFLRELNQFEARLTRLAKCYQYCRDCNEESAFLDEIKQQKLRLEQHFAETKDFHVIIREFYEHIEERGISSTSCRELLAFIFDCNIQIFIRDEFMRLKLCHTHNPTSKNILYLLLKNGSLSELVIDEEYQSLVAERMNQNDYYMKVLQDINKFVCKREYDEYFPNITPETNQKLNCIYCHKSTEAKLIAAILKHIPNVIGEDIKFKINKLTQNYIGPNHLLCTLLRYFESETFDLIPEEITYLVNSILKSAADKHTNISMFEWIITAYPQDKWLNELFYLELQNSFRDNLKKYPNLQGNIHRIKQKPILLLLEAKLYDLDDNVGLDCIVNCLESLSENTVNVELLKNLPLSKWPYILREQYLENKLLLITTWTNDELQKALYYLTCLESYVKSELINQFLTKMINNKKLKMSSEIMLKILVLLHNQEWSLNNFLRKFSTESGQDIVDILSNLARNKKTERSLRNLYDLIKNNSHTSEEIIKVLPKIKKFACLTKKFKTPKQNDITEWSDKFKEEFSRISDEEEKTVFIQENTNEILSWIFKAIRLKRGFDLRKTQRISILLLLSHGPNTLAQISTGEGKSLIVVAAAIFKALCNEKVDVITSSSVLAIRDAKINADIYELFGVKVSHNCHEGLDERKEAYSGSQVIYGDLSNFQRDYLLDRFYGQNILGDRNFENLIVDEVDSMLLDKGNNTLYLSHEIPGLDKLESVYLFLWKKIILSSPSEDTDWEEMLTDAVLYDLYGTLSPNDLKTALNINDFEANDVFEFLFQVKVVNRKKICLKPFSQVDQRKIPQKYQPYRDQLNYITTKILNRDREIVIPQCFYTFVETHLSLWIKNAIIASMMEEDQDYVVDVDRTSSRTDINPNITIIDKGTGTDQSNSQWEEALHQFLQLKHGCKVSAQSLKAVFISNVSYFKKYEKLFGLTGTLGSKVERDLLHELYDVHFVNIPTAKPKRLKELEPILCSTQYEWLFRIVNRTKGLLLEDRSVLIICETIKEVNQVHKAFQQAQMTNITVYKREYEECTLAQGQNDLEPGRVIIATNLAGRGTDIKINDTLNQAGGLHVLLTYLPSNNRIEQQAFGRAARSGFNGSAQLIFISKGNFLSMRSERDMYELQRISEIQHFYETRIVVEEEYFSQFSDVYHKIKNLTSEEIQLQRCLDRWAYWLDQNGDKLKTVATINNFRVLLKDLEDNYRNWNTWKHDPILLIKLGINKIIDKQYRVAIEIFNFVIKTEPNFCEAAHYFKACALAIKLDFEKRPFRGQMYDEYLEMLEELSKADQLFERRKDECIKASTFVQNLKESMKNTFVQIDAYNKQQENFINIYDFYQKTIKDMFGHCVSASMFKNPEITEIQSDEIYHKLLKNGYFKSAAVTNKLTRDDLNDISENYGILPGDLYQFLHPKSGRKIEEKSFLRELKQMIDLPSVEELWDIMIEQKQLTNETVFVIVEKSKLTNEQEEKLKTLKELKIDLNVNNKKQIFFKRVTHINQDSVYLFIKDKFERAIGPKLFDSFKRQRICVFNKIATVSKSKCLARINKFDFLQTTDLIADNISMETSDNIFNKLIEDKFLIKSDSNSYLLSGDYSEEQLNKIHLYNQSVVNVFRLKLSYRIAIQNMLASLEQSETPVFLNLSTEPHMSLMWDIIGKRIIHPVRVAKFDDDQTINQIISVYTFDSKKQKSVRTHIKNVLKNAASLLDKLEVPKFNLAPIENYLNEMQVTPLQEFSTCKLNALSFVLTAEEKKYTLKMILSTLAVMIVGLCQIAVGLVIQLFSVGLMTHVGGFLIGEGVSDLIYTATCWKSGYFSWDAYKDHKIKSVMISIATAGVGAILSKGVQYSRFGSKIASKGVTIAGKEVSEMAGQELIKNVGLKRIGLEVGKAMIKKTCEGVAKGLSGAAVDHVIESYLLNLCASISDAILCDINEAVQQHNINNTLEIVYENLGAAQAQELISFYTKKNFNQTQLNTKLISGYQKIFGVVVSGFSTAVTQGTKLQGAKLIAVLVKVLTYSQFLVHILEIRQSTNKLLNNIDLELCAELKKTGRSKSDKTFDVDKCAEFKQKVIFEWRENLSTNAEMLIARNIMKPILEKCGTVLMQKANNFIKSSYQCDVTKMHRNKFKKLKRKLDQQLENATVTEEARVLLVKNYQDSLMKLRAQTKDPNLYADLVLENGHMDSVCLKSCANALPTLLKNRSISAKPIKIIVENVDTSVTEEFASGGSGDVGDTHVIRLKLENNHYTNLNQDGTTSNATGYDCLYNSLVDNIPELSNLTPGEFRKNISNTIRTDPGVKQMISLGHHQFTIAKNCYGGYIEQKINTKELHDDLMSYKSKLSPSSVGEFTSKREDDPLHLSESAKSIEKQYIGNPTNAVDDGKGGKIYLDNRRIVAASTINNPDVSIDVRVFEHAEKLPDDMKEQYGDHDTVFDAAKDRMRRSGSVDNIPELGFSPDQVRIRKGGEPPAKYFTDDKFKEGKNQFFRKTKDMGYIKYSRRPRSNSTGRA